MFLERCGLWVCMRECVRVVVWLYACGNVCLCACVCLNMHVHVLVRAHVCLFACVRRLVPMNTKYAAKY